MGLFDYVLLEHKVTLPHFPSNQIDPSDYTWKTKSLYNHMRRFKITNDGRLLREEKEHTEKTEQEKQEEAKEHGFDSWEEYYNTWENAIEKGSVDIITEKNLPIMIHEKKVNEKFWINHNMHGSFTFYKSFDDPDIFFNYEARFTRGTLDDIVFLGERLSDETVEETINRIKKWQTTK